MTGQSPTSDAAAEELLTGDLDEAVDVASTTISETLRDILNNFLVLVPRPDAPRPRRGRAA